MPEIMTPTSTEYCEACKAYTKRCEFYPTGRSRQQGKCLECDRKDPRHGDNYGHKPQYCYECGQLSEQFRP